MVGYDPMSNSLIVMRSPGDNSTNSNRAYVYDFDSGGWTYSTSMFTDSANYTNFITDWNNNLTVGKYDGSSDVNFFKYLPISSASGGQEFRTRDIDFGQPGVRKKIYKVTMTYRSSVEQETPLYYDVNGNEDLDTEFADGSGGSGITPQGSAGGAGYLESTSASGALWGTAVFKPSSPVECNSIAFKLDLPSSGTFEVNDMTVEYRVLGAKAAS